MRVVKSEMPWLLSRLLLCTERTRTSDGLAFDPPRLSCRKPGQNHLLYVPQQFENIDKPQVVPKAGTAIQGLAVPLRV